LKGLDMGLRIPQISQGAMFCDDPAGTAAANRRTGYEGAATLESDWPSSDVSI
jgi:hypothetical protein